MHVFLKAFDLKFGLLSTECSQRCFCV